MPREAPDRHFYAEMRDLNLEFLTLVARCRPRPGAGLFGLDAAVMGSLGHLSAAQFEAIAATPCLLASFRALPRHGLSQVAEPPLADDPAWGGDTRVFAAGLLTYLWQIAGRDRLQAALCAGLQAEASATGLRFRDIPGCASRALLNLEARFCRQARFWPDLVRAAREGEPRRLELLRLTALQLAVAEAGSVRQPSAVPIRGAAAC